MSLEAVAPISDLHAAALKAPAESESPLAPVTPKSSNTERDSSFQRLMNFLHKNSEESKQDKREHKDGFAYLEAFLDRQSEQSTDQVVKHAVAGPVVAAGAATAAQAKPDLNKQLNATLQTTGPVAKPLDRPEQNKFSNNAEGLKQAADNKQNTTEAKIDTLKKDVTAIASKMNPQQMQTAMSDNRAPGGVVGMAAEMGLHATGHPIAAAAVGVASAINGQGQGTHSTQKTASAPVLSAKEQKKAPYVMSYGEPTPQPIAAPSGPSVADMNKQMAKGPGFGTDLTARSNLAEQNLDGMKISNLDKLIERSPAMKAATSQLDNAKDVQRALANRDDVDKKSGKNLLDDKTQEFVKAPAAPAPASFRV